MVRGLGQRPPRMELLRLGKLHPRGEATKHGVLRGQQASQKNKMAELDTARLADTMERARSSR